MARILVVDDSPVDRRLISGLLERESEWSVETADDGQAALDILVGETFDLVVTDLQMPAIDGVELVRRLRELDVRIPVVLVTAFGSEDQSRAALRAGAANFLHKGRLILDLVPTVRNVLDWSERIRDRPHPHVEESTGNRSMAFVLGNELGQIPCLIETFSDRLPDWARDDELRISMALDEALTNAVCHGNLEVDSSLKCLENLSAFEKRVNIRKNCHPWCARRVRVEAVFSSEEIEFRIRDEGPGFDPGSLPDPTCGENLSKPSGRGIFLIRTFMDNVTHNRTGNQITMVKRREAGEPGSC